MIQLNESSVPERNPKVAARVVEGHALVVVLDKREVHRLDPVGSRIWELCEGRSVGAIADQLVEDFEVERVVALEDTLGFLKELQDVGAILSVGAP